MTSFRRPLLIYQGHFYKVVSLCKMARMAHPSVTACVNVCMCVRVLANPHACEAACLGGLAGKAVCTMMFACLLTASLFRSSCDDINLTTPHSSGPKVFKLCVEGVDFEAAPPMLFFC